MISYTVACDNITLRGESDDPKFWNKIYPLAVIENDLLEINRDVIAEGLANLAIYGTAEMRLRF